MKATVFFKLVVVFLVVTMSACASLPDDFIKEDSFAIVSDHQSISRALHHTDLSLNEGLSGFHALSDGKEALAARLKLIKHASQSLDVQYYIWHNDLAGNVMYYALIEAAKRGVRVRILLDDMDTAGKEHLLHFIDAHPNVDIRLFNPFANRTWRIRDFLTDFRRVNRRMHNKSLTADGVATIFGGRNIGDEYFDATDNVVFNDVDVLGIGPVAGEVESVFDLYWNSDWSYPLKAFKHKPMSENELQQFYNDARSEMSEINETSYAEEVRRLDMVEFFDINDSFEFEWGKWILGYDDPSKVIAKEVLEETHLAPNLKRALDAAESEINIVSPYFVPGKQFTKYLIDKVASGVTIRVLTNSLAANDVSVVHAGYMRYRKDLVAGGIELYEFKAEKNTERQKEKEEHKRLGSSSGSLHAKYFTFDKKYIFVGSFNLDARSVVLNTEMGVYFKSELYGKRVSKAFKNRAPIEAYRLELVDGNLEWVTFENGNEVRFQKEPETGFWKRTGVKFMSYFVPESQL